MGQAGPSGSLLDGLGSVGYDLDRPECVLCTASGLLHTADWRGVALTTCDGRSRVVIAGTPASDGPLRPNGIALRRDGSYLVAHLGTRGGGVYRLHASGELVPVVLEIEGVPVPPTNFVLLNQSGRLWITFSYTKAASEQRFVKETATGCIAVLDQRGLRVVADGLKFTNEVQIDPAGRCLYANETYGRRLSRFARGEHGVLGPRETVTECGPGIFPDGIAFDVEGAA